jgi:hypothetical protein
MDCRASVHTWTYMYPRYQRYLMQVVDSMTQMNLVCAYLGTGGTPFLPAG